MVYLFHGDDNFQSRQKLISALTNYHSVQYLDKKNICPEELVKFSGNLFSSQQKKAVVLENLFSLPVKKLKKSFEYLNKLNNELDFFIWENKQISGNKTRQINKKNIKTFKLPTSIWKFLDNFGQNNLKLSLKYFYETLKTHPVELILFLIQRRTKEMLVYKANPEALKRPDWQKSKIKKQTQNLNLEQIKKLFSRLIHLEYHNKTGQLGGTLQNGFFNLLLWIHTQHENY